jgi:hypothetical protein
MDGFDATTFRRRFCDGRRDIPPCRKGNSVDFSRVKLSEDDQRFRDELRAFLKTLVTEEVIQRDRETGENFDEGVHLALGKTVS